MDATLVGTILGPVVTALLAGLGFWLREIRQRRNRTMAHQQVVDQAQKQIVFVEAWLRAHAQAASPADHEAVKRQVLGDLHRIHALVDQSTTAVRRDAEPLTLARMMSGLLLLGHRRIDATKSLVVFYYIALAFAVLVVCGLAAFGGFAAVSGSSSSDSPSEPGYTKLEGIFLGLCCFAVGAPLAVLPAWLLHRFARWEDRPTPPVPVLAGSAPPQVRQPAQVRQPDRADTPAPRGEADRPS